MRVFTIALYLFCVGLLLPSLSYCAEGVNATFEQLKTELQNEGMLPQEVSSVERPVKEMLKQGAAKDDLKNVLRDLSNRGVRGRDLQNITNSMNELVKKGETPRRAGNIVSQAAHQALAEGLRGQDLAAKVQ